MHGQALIGNVRKCTDIAGFDTPDDNLRAATVGGEKVSLALLENDSMHWRGS